MASADDVKKLAALARIEVKDEELAKFASEFDSILSYVGQLNELSVGKTERVVSPVHNVFREDGEPHESGAYTEKLVEAFPEKDGDYLSVKQIISYD